MSIPDNRSYNVTALYPSMDRARRGVEVLEERGVDADDIFLAGPAAEEAAAPGIEGTVQRDRAIGRQGGRTALQGIVAGGVSGALLGLVLGLIFLSGSMGGIAALTIGGFTAGAGVGLFSFAIVKEKQSQEWEATLDDAPGPVVVGVHTDDPQTFAAASDALTGTGPEHVKRYDAQGRPLSGTGTAGG